MEEGFKYLGFILKPNSYSFKYYMWLYKKIEGRIGCWTYKFLSRGGRLVLLKAVLQSILVYWARIAYILKGILQKLRKKLFSFLWSANRHSEGAPLAKWQMLACPKYLGGWGIKNPFLFCQSLVAKTLWRLIKNPKTLWGRVLTSKYFPNGSITEWIRKQDKSFKNGSIGWKAVVLAFPRVGNWFTWMVGNGRRSLVRSMPNVFTKGNCLEKLRDFRLRGRY